MRSNFLKSKLHRIKLTDVHIDYEGSCAIDETILNASDICEYEMLHIYNLANGNRFTTYAIKAEKDSGIVSFNGAAAFQGKVNDLIIICTYTQLEASEVKNHKLLLIIRVYHKWSCTEHKVFVCPTNNYGLVLALLNTS